MRALRPGDGPHLPPRGKYATVRELVEVHGFSLSLIDALARAGRIVWEGTRYLFV